MSLKFMRRHFSVFVTSTLVFGMLAFVPTALAAFLSFNVEPSKTFNINAEQTIDFGVKMNGYDKDYGVGFGVRGPLGEANEQYKLLKVYNYTGNDTYTFQWDGKINGVDATPGKYKAEFSNIGLNPNPLPYEFDVVTAQPILAFGLKPYSQYAIGSGEYEVYTNISGLFNDTTVDLYIVKNNPPQLVKVDSHTFTYDKEGHVLTWDGKLNGNDPVAGEYELHVYGEDTDGNKTNILKEPLTIVQATQPNLTFVGTPKKQISPGEDYKVSIKLTGADNIQVSAGIDTPYNKTLGKGINMDNGEVLELVWDGDDLETLGTYDLWIRGEGANNYKTNKLTYEFNVTQSTQCGGYNDMKKTDKGCDAVEWVQSEGIMTGNPDNTFEPNDFFQRDEAAKVSLEAFNLYKANTDYCNGDPFPDVDEDAWHGNYICRGISAGMVTGYKSGPDTGLFKPERSLNLIEMFALILRNVDESMQYGPSFNKSFSETQWYSGYAAYAYENGLYPNKAGLLPTQFVTRLEVAEFLYQLHKKGEL